MFFLYGIICPVTQFIIILHWGLFWILNYMDIIDWKPENRIVPTSG